MGGRSRGRRTSASSSSATACSSSPSPATLYARYPDFPEGRLTKARAHVVSRATCAVVGEALGLGERLVARAPAGLEDDAKRLGATPSVVGAVLEAALGALFLEHGFAAIEAAIVGAFSEHIETAVSSRVDPKSDLQEILAPNRPARDVHGARRPKGRRTTAASRAPPSWTERSSGAGEGRTKKDAEQEAAREALAKVEAT